MMKYITAFLKAFYKLAFAPDRTDSPLSTLHETFIPVFIAKDAMQRKPGLSFDEKQKQLIGSKIKIDFKFILDNPDPNKQVLNKIMVHECKVLWITIAYNELSIAYDVNHLTKAISGGNVSVNPKLYHPPRANFLCQMPGGRASLGPLILINFTIFTVPKTSIINLPNGYLQIRWENIDLPMNNV